MISRARKKNNRCTSERLVAEEVKNKTLVWCDETENFYLKAAAQLNYRPCACQLLPAARNWPVLLSQSASRAYADRSCHASVTLRLSVFVTCSLTTSTFTCASVLRGQTFMTSTTKMEVEEEYRAERERRQSIRSR